MNRKGTSKQDRIAEQLAQHHSKVVKVTEQHKAYNNNNKGSYRDEEEDDDDDDNDNDNRNSAHGRPSKNSTVTAPRQSYQRNHYQNEDDDDDDDNRASKDNWAKPKTKSNRSMGNDRESAASSRSGSRHRRQQDDDDYDDDEDEDRDNVVDDDEEEDDDDNEGGARTRKQNIPIEPLDLSDMKRFLLSPIPRGAGIVQCYIKRNKVGVNKLFPVYSLYLKVRDLLFADCK